MKKSTLLLLLVLFVSGVSYAEGGTVDANGKRQGHWIIVGKMQANKAYAADAKVEEGDYKDGLKVGIWILYFPTGIKKGEYTYVNNRPNGHAITYNENGTKYEEGTWVGNRWVGAYQLFYEDGTPRQSFNYTPIGQRDGKQTYYNPNGTLQIEVEMKNGKENGWKKEYDENGNLIRETYYNNGAIDPSKTKEYPKPAKPAIAPEDPANDKAEVSTKAGASEKAVTPNWNGEGPNTLMNGGQVTQKGTFHNYTLVTGEKRFYDSNGNCIRVKLYRDSKYVGDGPIPVE
jgi:antitoxin component YwqK of YwqJK toxin-antitoxin module